MQCRTLIEFLVAVTFFLVVADTIGMHHRPKRMILKRYYPYFYERCRQPHRIQFLPMVPTTTTTIWNHSVSGINWLRRLWWTTPARFVPQTWPVSLFLCSVASFPLARNVAPTSIVPNGPDIPRSFAWSMSIRAPKVAILRPFVSVNQSPPFAIPRINLESQSRCGFMYIYTKKIVTTRASNMVRQKAQKHTHTHHCINDPKPPSPITVPW